MPLSPTAKIIGQNGARAKCALLRLAATLIAFLVLLPLSGPARPLYLSHLASTLCLALFCQLDYRWESTQVYHTRLLVPCGSLLLAPASIATARTASSDTVLSRSIDGRCAGAPVERDNIIGHHYVSLVSNWVTLLLLDCFCRWVNCSMPTVTVTVIWNE